MRQQMFSFYLIENFIVFLAHWAHHYYKAELQCYSCFVVLRKRRETHVDEIFCIACCMCEGEKTEIKSLCQECWITDRMRTHAQLQQKFVRSELNYLCLQGERSIIHVPQIYQKLGCWVYFSFKLCCKWSLSIISTLPRNLSHRWSRFSFGN
jgi:hypothetical protein